MAKEGLSAENKGVNAQYTASAIKYQGIDPSSVSKLSGSATPRNACGSQSARYIIQLRSR